MHAMDMRWDDLQTVTLLVRHGTLAGAAEALGVNYTTVARRIRRAEAAFGEALFERLADGYQPTDASRLIAQHGDAMEDTEHALMRRLKGREAQLSGPLTITAPQLLIAYVLSPLLDQFTRTHPQIDLRILATNELVDLARREADVAIRISQNPGDALKGLRLLEQESASFASPKWSALLQEAPEAMVDWIVYDVFPGVPKGASADYPNQRVRFRFDDMVAMAGAAVAGLGVVRMPMFLGRAMPGLVQVPVLPPVPYLDIWVVAHAGVWPSAKVRAFVKPLTDFCRAERKRFVSNK